MNRFFVLKRDFISSYFNFFFLLFFPCRLLFLDSAEQHDHRTTMTRGKQSTKRKEKERMKMKRVELIHCLR
jgi:hypothetical protein